MYTDIKFIAKFKNEDKEWEHKMEFEQLEPAAQWVGLFKQGVKVQDVMFIMHDYWLELSDKSYEIVAEMITLEQHNKNVKAQEEEMLKGMPGLPGMPGFFDPNAGNNGGLPN